MKIDFSYLRPKKAEAMKKWYGKEFTKKENLEILELSDALLLPLKKFEGDNLLFGRGGVVTKEGEYVSISGIKGRFEKAYIPENEKYRNEKVCYCGYLVNQWGHFLVEAVARLWYFLNNDATIDKYVFVVNQAENRVIRGNYREFFELLGVWDKIEIINEPTRYRQVVVPERGFVMRSHWSTEYKNIFETIAKNVQDQPERVKTGKIFLSRAKIKGFDKKEYNMDMLDEFFEKNGYQVIFPENYSLSGLITLLQGADVVATMSGSVQHNMMFAPDGIKHIILEKTVVTVDFMLDINIMKDFDAVHIDSNLVIYPVNIGYGPYIQVYSGCLKRYAEDHGMLAADPSFENPKRMKRFLRRYMQIYRNEYQYRWYINDWELQFIDSIKEACDEGYEYYLPYLSRQKPFAFYQYFMPHYWKRFARRMLNRG